MTPNDLKWLQMTLFVSNKLTEVIWDNLEPFKSWSDKISFTIKTQCLLSFCLWGLIARFGDFKCHHSTLFSHEVSNSEGKSCHMSFKFLKKGIWLDNASHIFSCLLACLSVIGLSKLFLRNKKLLKTFVVTLWKKWKGCVILEIQIT